MKKNLWLVLFSICLIVAGCQQRPAADVNQSVNLNLTRDDLSCGDFQYETQGSDLVDLRGQDKDATEKQLLLAGENLIRDPQFKRHLSCLTQENAARSQ